MPSDLNGLVTVNINDGLSTAIETVRTQLTELGFASQHCLSEIPAHRLPNNH